MRDLVNNCWGSVAKEPGGSSIDCGFQVIKIVTGYAIFILAVGIDSYVTATLIDGAGSPKTTGTIAMGEENQS